MSEVRFQLKKAIPIIVVTWILSLATTLTIVYVVPNIFHPTWHEVATFSGSFQGYDTENTDSFYISSDHWRFHWEVRCEEPPPEDVELVLYIQDLINFPAGGSKLRKVWLEDFRRTSSDGLQWFGLTWGTEYMTGSGMFSLRLVGVSVDWEIAVEAYY